MIAGEPAALPEDAIATLRDHLRIEPGQDDAALATLMLSALALCERFTGQVAIARELQETIPARRDWRRLTPLPVRAITGVSGLPAEGAAFVLDADAYAIDIDAEGQGWVRVMRPGSAGRAIVTLTAGLADAWAGLPAPIRQGVIRLAAHLYAHRDDADDPGPPAAVAALWRPWRRLRLGTGARP